jgi:hypothetical protein
MLQKTHVQRPKCGNPTTELPSGRLVTHPWEFSTTYKPQCQDKQGGQLDSELWQGKKKKKVKRKWKKEKYDDYISPASKLTRNIKTVF